MHVIAVLTAITHAMSRRQLILLTVAKGRIEKSIPSCLILLNLRNSQLDPLGNASKYFLGLNQCNFRFTHLMHTLDEGLWLN
jgi:hypothetical protein